jgi:hypothetical protein
MEGKGRRFHHKGTKINTKGHKEDRKQKAEIRVQKTEGREHEGDKAGVVCALLCSLSVL